MVVKLFQLFQLNKEVKMGLIRFLVRKRAKKDALGRWTGLRKAEKDTLRKSVNKKRD